jgi:UDP-N-acetylmuramate dehydrogenase
VTSVPTSSRVALRDHTTLRLGGEAAEFVTAADEDTLVTAVRSADREGAPLLVLGGGSNLVVADAGLAGVTVRVATTGLACTRRGDAAHVAAEAGMTWDDLVARTVADGFGGLECLSGIPGCVGAAPVQNIGAYGVEIAEYLVSVDLLDRLSGSVRRVAASELGLDFRTSMLKDTERAVVLRAEFALTDDGLSAPIRYPELAAALGVPVETRVPVTAAREAVLGLRSRKGMVLDPDDHDTWSAGSFFVNPVLDEAELAPVMARVRTIVGEDAAVPRYPVSGARTKLSAAWLIERAGFPKGYPGPGGRVALSSRHTLALTNRGGASTTDLLALAAEIRDGVHAAFGLTLRPEPVLVGCEL